MSHSCKGPQVNNNKESMNFFKAFAKATPLRQPFPLHSLALLSCLVATQMDFQTLEVNKHFIK